jgi:putative ABC transport system permease protein
MPSQLLKPISQFHFLFQFRENMGIALETIRTNKFRSFLTILGVVIGVTSVISVASIIQGLNNLVANRVSQLGSNVFFVSRLPAFTFGRLPEKIRQRKYLKYEDALAIRERCPTVKEVTIFQTRFGGLGGTNLVRYGNEKIENVILRSAEPAYTRVLPIFNIRDGRSITENDNEHSSNVCVIGSGIAGTLFPVTDPIGNEINVNGTIFTIIGTFDQDPGLFGGPGIDQFVVIPYRTFHRMYPELKENIIAVSVPDPQLSTQAQGEVIEVLRRQRKIPANGENDFDLFESDILTTVWKQLTGAVVILTLVISSIGLLVGGIGVMNIMLVSVTERTREIGIRKAVGAQKKDIMQQFLMEAMTLTGAGGLIGILVGALISVTIKTLIPSLPTQVSLLWVGIAFSVSVAVGLFFGIFPAKRAADLDPIVALRYE